MAISLAASGEHNTPSHAVVAGSAPVGREIELFGALPGVGHLTVSSLLDDEDQALELVGAGRRGVAARAAREQCAEAQGEEDFESCAGTHVGNSAWLDRVSP